MKICNVIYIVLSAGLISLQLSGQISPGDLSKFHAHLEGISNCTKCHVLGEKVSNDKCMNCHAELTARIDMNQGYHSSIDVQGKECVSCHSDHHGRNFEIIHFDKQEFNHNLTGYELLDSHSKKNCEDCHKDEFITNIEIKDKKYTFLGLNSDCLSCHNDYHQGTLPIHCFDCHGFDSFPPATNFNHDKTKFLLKGKHNDVKCEECHKIENRNNQKFQIFSNIPFANCTDCHKDVHHDKFGQNCRQCHTEQSFHEIKGIKDFNHDRTNFMLKGKHQMVNCKTCHKVKYTDPLKHEQCNDCHIDYHENQFNKLGISPNCSSCHSVLGFTLSSFTIERHNEGSFKLEGTHEATPCFACHKKNEKWNFKEIGKKCNECHADIHKTFIDEKYYPDTNCMTCHTVNFWNDINFDHAKTDFVLEGAHKEQTCRPCHFVKEDNGNETQRFSDMNADCLNCHKDKHYGQFEANGVTNCINCHEFYNWKANKFDHYSAAFKLEGEHKKVACEKCHKEKKEGQIIFIQYKFKDFRCITCHK